MPTYAKITADMLIDTAKFFRTLAEQNADVRKDMTSNAEVYDRMANLITSEPYGTGPTGHRYADLAARLLRDTAEFYKRLAQDNEPIREQMITNAGIYEQIADALVKDPMGVPE